jgi:putative hydrolase of HD superfamily
MLGMVTRYWESRETLWMSVGLAIYDPRHWGRGLGYEALGLWTDYLFREMPEIVRLDLRTWSGNVGMVRLAEKLGYVREACFRKARIVDGKYYDSLGYGVLREEWSGRYPDGFAVSLCKDGEAGESDER